MKHQLNDLRLGSLFGWRDLRVQMLELAGFDSATTYERVDLALLQANYSAEPVRRQLAFVDQPVQRSWGKPQSTRRFFGAEPIAVCLSHDDQGNTLSAPLSISDLCGRNRR